MIIADRKKAAAYHVSLSAVKNIHIENKGIEKIKQAKPANIIQFSFRLISNNKKTKMKIMSCIFIY